MLETLINAFNVRDVDLCKNGILNYSKYTFSRKELLENLLAILLS